MGFCFASFARIDSLVSINFWAFSIKSGEVSNPRSLGYDFGEKFTSCGVRTYAQDQVLSVSILPQSEDLPLQTLYISNGGETYAWELRATSNLVKMIFHNPGMQEDLACGPLLDVVAIKELFSPRFTKGDAKNNCHKSMMIKAFAAKGTVNAPFKSEGEGKFKTFNFQFKAILYRTGLSFFSPFYHTWTNDYRTLWVLTSKKFGPAA
ncbi:uncharacterized protein LOC111391557 [Olea europaea subsp. europaea]|uniref:Uncharacterized protein LOC111391557 n=1 Tax=Olea europaea subsp. europaea TaxID=158383 RepID=A0A8S0RKS5_OLEEU|nr:uncharacterized protein LOC111391557 [Olea europaea subsp. europaea]